MDATYARSGLPFEPALFCLTSVISRAAPNRAVADAGLKAMSAEYGMPVPIDPGIRVTRLTDEHAVIEIGPGADPSIGDRLLLQPAHVDPTVNLHSRLHVWDVDRWEVWETDGRYL
jgi:D-serine deaminase-like pyridoxal phosphate-dependent protein